MKKLHFIHGSNCRVVILALLTSVIALFHFVVPTESHTYHTLHIVLRKLYFLPPVMAGAWFGLRGAVCTTSAVTVLFSLHAFLDWPGNYMEQANQVGELASFWVVGLVPGWLFDRQRALLADIATANEETLLALVSALDMRAKNSRLHSLRVREYALHLADRLGVSEKERKAIGFGALLHEVGKVAIHDSVFTLLRRIGLPERELKEMRAYPEEGYNLLRKIGFLREAAEIVRAHQEHYDGSGYPRGLKGEEIPVGARMLLIADTFETLVTGTGAVECEEAVRMIRGGSGREFDPKLVDLFAGIGCDELRRVTSAMVE
ncbi:HD-GYP domain-containing protein [Geobacter grbiciae]|uniref:HD-GYP domain-containing protein n=1 Tax=Geobacter grbiciae TaxID=155042 RepID=UPI001C00F66F|nr:HD domain-containing phosphohydrolase [Geobacter grbiciae]MBT1074253.1 HD domain-containing protein [Geobacter grbiciae]